MTIPVLLADLSSLLGGGWIPLVIVLLGVGGFIILWMVLSRYTKVGPNQVLVVSGRKHRYLDPDGTERARGFRIVKGGGTFVYPIIEKIDVLSRIAHHRRPNSRGLHQQRRAGESGRRGADQSQGGRHLDCHRRRAVP